MPESWVGVRTDEWTKVHAFADGGRLLPCQSATSFQAVLFGNVRADGLKAAVGVVELHIALDDVWDTAVD